MELAQLHMEGENSVLWIWVGICAKTGGVVGEALLFGYPEARIAFEGGKVIRAGIQLSSQVLDRSRVLREVFWTRKYLHSYICILSTTSFDLKIDYYVQVFQMFTIHAQLECS